MARRGICVDSRKVMAEIVVAPIEIDDGYGKSVAILARRLGRALQRGRRDHEVGGAVQSNQIPHSNTDSVASSPPINRHPGSRMTIVGTVPAYV